ncbi:MAG: hypothetical protein WAX89_08325 [Alphaproteobacteria bacterium]
MALFKQTLLGIVADDGKAVYLRANQATDDHTLVVRPEDDAENVNSSEQMRTTLTTAEVVQLRDQFTAYLVAIGHEKAPYRDPDEIIRTPG